MRSVSGVGRVAAILAVLVAVIGVGMVLFGGIGGGYVVKAEFQNASQLVAGNLVQIGGSSAGTVDDIQISKDGQAVVTMKIENKFKPLRFGTRAVVRQASLSGIANRYVDLQLPPSGGAQTEGTQLKKAGDEIPDGGTIPVTETVTAVDLDQIFNVFDPVARVAVQDFFKGSAQQFRNRGEEANRGLQYLNPALSTSRRLFNELNADNPLLERFIVDSARFMTAVADRRDDLAALIENLNRTTGALAREKVALAEAIGALPDFLRSANGTFVNLRSTLNDVEPLVDASKPVAPRLNAFLKEAEPFARDARPTVRDLNAIVRRPGADNDLVELNRTLPPLARIGLDSKTNRRLNTLSGKPGGEVIPGRTRGAFPEMTEALKDSAPTTATLRPYTPDLFGWFDDFSNTGTYDALGGISRTQAYFNVNSPAGPPAIDILDADPLTPGNQNSENLDARDQIFKDFANLNQFQRCPGAAEERQPDGSNVWEGRAADFDRDGTIDCQESDRATGQTGSNR